MSKNLIVILHYQIDQNFSSKVHFYDIFNNCTENFRALRTQWSSSPLTLVIVSMPMSMRRIALFKDAQ
jgi:hypothetical protein